jgi:predicted RNA-binding Zn-ribbon protein involved in translation (DUF1610 family)
MLRKLLKYITSTRFITCRRTDEVSYSISLHNFKCPDCGSSNIVPDKEQPPFIGDKENKLIVNPLICEKCKYAFSVYL